ncbi:hypothetical protein JYG33_13930 [Alcaligenes sp. SORT26]|uniref:DUF6056 family protein n=1 Tax=Alcaligenes sp. SORT26 TaxID=2813780 RepID=UPI001A9E5F8E|nr:DUF6056 family protein [Alcaligenes sp. SORT26]QTB99065.1 hypothetical protein JYG33_13930 [Alcaligenes sp. SORT26]
MSSTLSFAESRFSQPLLGRRSGAWVFIIFSVLAVMATWSIYWLTPMISDDFSYANKGIAWESIKHHYLHWSGRLVSDTLSSAMLSLAPGWLKATLNTAALFGLITILTALGAQLAGRALRPSLLLLVFTLYWLVNPHLGQTTFWLVGAANYLWPNLFNFGFVLAFVWYLQKGRPSVGTGLALCVLAVLAGCSNENTGIISWCLLAYLSLRHFQRTGSLSKWHLAWLLCMGLGIAVLVLAPGNQVRAEVFAHWYEQPLSWRIWEHFGRRFPDAMLRYWGAILVMLVWRLVAGPASSEPVRRAIFLLIGASLLANAILVLAPNIPKRALNGGLMYLLVALSIYGHDLLAQRSVQMQRCLWVILGAGCSIWLLSSTLMLRSYHAAWQQDKVRLALLTDARKNHRQHVDLPKYFFLPTLRSRDRFDTHFNRKAMADYHHCKAVINEYAVNQHYDLESGAPAKP